MYARKRGARRPGRRASAGPWPGCRAGRGSWRRRRRWSRACGRPRPAAARHPSSSSGPSPPTPPGMEPGESRRGAGEEGLRGLLALPICFPFPPLASLVSTRGLGWVRFGAPSNQIKSRLGLVFFCSRDDAKHSTPTRSSGKRAGPGHARIKKIKVYFRVSLSKTGLKIVLLVYWPKAKTIIIKKKRQNHEDEGRIVTLYKY